MNDLAANGGVAIALAILGYAGFTRVTAPPQVINAVGWVVFVLALVLIATNFVHLH
jgi:hypothetical protein